MGDAYVNGAAPPLVTQDFFEYTSQRSTFIMNVAGKVTMNVTFLSPLTPTDIKRQSIIGTYLSVTVTSRDNANHNVQLYTDTSAGMSGTSERGLGLANHNSEWVNPTHNSEPVAWRYQIPPNFSKYPAKIVQLRCAEWSCQSQILPANSKRV